MTESKKKPNRGIRNNNPLNIRKGNTWQGERPVQSDEEFEEFTSMAYGIRAAFKLMRNHITGFGGQRPKMNTYKKLISVWAPPIENATTNYLNFVCDNTGHKPNDVINPDDCKTMCVLARAMARVETGEWIDNQIFLSAWMLL